MSEWILRWENGMTEVIKGRTIDDALENAGIGHLQIPAIESIKEVTKCESSHPKKKS